jgi:hypothetical protein
LFKAEHGPAIAVRKGILQKYAASNYEIGFNSISRKKYFECLAISSIQPSPNLILASFKLYNPLPSSIPLA